MICQSFSGLVLRNAVASTGGSDDDPRIHARANCRYRDQRTALDITYELIKADLLEEVFG